MLTKDQKREVEITLEAALMLAEDGQTVEQIAERVYDSEPGLVASIQRTWIVERFRWMLYRRQQKISNSNQLPLPGFEELPRRLVLKTRRVRLYSADMNTLLEYRAILAARRDRRIEALDRLITLMRPYSEAKGGMGKTVGEVMAEEMKKLERMQ